MICGGLAALFFAMHATPKKKIVKKYSMPDQLPRKRRAHHIFTLHMIRKRPSRITADRLLGFVNGRPGPEKAPRRRLGGGTLGPQILIVGTFFLNLSTGP
jgi:hypothetical protein